MGLFDRLFGGQQRFQQPAPQAQQAPRPQQGGSPGAPRTAPDADEQAVRRYQYLLQTADPRDIERVHEEAFAKLTPEQRQEVLARLAQAAPDERVAGDSPQDLARAATRAEMRRPGTLTSAFGGYGGMGMGGIGMGGMRMPGLGATLLTSIAGTAVGVATMYGMMAGFDAMFGDDHDYNDGYADGMHDAQDGQQDDGAQGDDGRYDDSQGDGSADTYADGGSYDDGGLGSDLGSDAGSDLGSDLGDFGGFDGGGDFGGDF